MCSHNNTRVLLPLSEGCRFMFSAPERNKGIATQPHREHPRHKDASHFACLVHLKRRKLFKTLAMPSWFLIPLRVSLDGRLPLVYSKNCGHGVLPPSIQFHPLTPFVHLSVIFLSLMYLQPGLLTNSAFTGLLRLASLPSKEEYCT